MIKKKIGGPTSPVSLKDFLSCRIFWVNEKDSICCFVLLKMNLLVSDCYRGDMQGQTSFEWLEQVEEEDQQGEKN